MHMWSVFPWPGRTMGASFALLGWANPSFPPAALRFKQWLGLVSVAAAERRHHRIFLLGRRWVILGWTVVMQMLQSTMATYHRSQANTFLPHTVPRPLKEKSRMGACDAWNLCSSRLTLFCCFEFSPLFWICSVFVRWTAKLRGDFLCWKILVPHDGDVEGGPFTF